jgi:hypothetical protein
MAEQLQRDGQQFFGSSNVVCFGYRRFDFDFQVFKVAKVHGYPEG